MADNDRDWPQLVAVNRCNLCVSTHCLCSYVFQLEIRYVLGSSSTVLSLTMLGATYHVGYPCVARSVFGMWGSYYVVAARYVICSLNCCLMIRLPA